MGVHGLWRLLDATGKPVALETLEGKVLAVDVSIWLYQVMQGYQDGRGNPLPNAHLLGLFNRICKLLYYKIKPIFVFDGGVPLLKKNTIASRRKQKSMASSKAQKMKTDLINNLLKRTVVKGALGVKDTERDEEKEESRTVERFSVHSSLNLFRLPAMPVSNEPISEEEDDPELETESSIQLSPRKQARWKGNIHSVDVSSAEFRALPPDVRHDILTDLKASRKENSWGRLHEMPEESHDFSNYQMKRLLKRRNVQECLEEAEREMGGKTMTLEELDILLTEQGIATTTKDDRANRIAADNLTRFVYINGQKGNAPTAKETKDTIRVIPKPDTEDHQVYLLNDSDSEDDVQIAENLREYELDNDWESDWESDDEQKVTAMKSEQFQKLVKSSDLNPAMAYMLEHSGLSQEEIMCIIEQSRNKSKKITAQHESKDLKKCCKNLDFVIKSEPRDSGDENSSQFTEHAGIAGVAENSRSNSPSNFSVKSDSLTTDFTIPENNSSSQNGSRSPEVTANNQIDETVTENAVTESPPRKEDSVAISESESDDFVEVDDVPIPSELGFSPKQTSKPTLEIAIVPELPLEEDMFADVFVESKIPVQTAPSTVSKTPEPIDSPEKHQLSEYEINSTEDKNLCEVPVKSPIVNTTKEMEIREKDTTVATTVPLQTDETVTIEESITVDGSKAIDSREPLANSIGENEKKNSFKLPVEEDELLNMQAQLEDEQKEISGNLGKLERQATDITDQMRLEAQELLRFFGIPYVVAPMEAEAQCAYLETVNLTDGTITDDSDIWLFGGRCVYKNFFNLNKHVLQFRSCDIRHHFKLTREQMVQLALLVGSDYTIGVSGIGPVTALEIIGTFPAEEGHLLKGLINFRYWMNSGRAAGPGKASLRTKLRNIRVEKGFPSEAVVQAYLTPTVDESKERFTWNKPNVTLLCDFAREKFGWSKNKFELIFNPIMKRLMEPQKQKGIDSYFHVKLSQKSIEGTLSKRVQKAVERLGDDPTEDVADDEVPVKRPRKSRAKSGTSSAQGAQNAPNKEPKITNVIVPSEAPSTSKEITAIAEYIPQREKDKANALKKKLRAIEVFRKSKKGPGYTKRTKRSVCKIKAEAELSESSDSS